MTAKPVVFLLACLAFFSAVHLVGGTVWLNTPYYLLDLWFTGDVVWREWLGQTPHLDFGTPIGQAYFWVYGLSLWLAGPTTLAILLASVLAGLLAAFLAWALLRRDVPAWIAVLVALYAFGCAVTPRWMGHGWPAEFSHLAYYNRWGWAFLIPLALYPLVPGRGGRIDAPAAVLLGLGVAFLSLLKITFGLAAAGFIGLALATGHLRFLTALVAFAAGCAALVATQLIEGNLVAYVSDIRQALVAGDDSLLERALERRAMVEAGGFYGAAVAAILLLGVLGDVLALRGGRVVQALWRPAVFCAALLVVGFGVAVQNHPKTETPFFVTAVILAYLWARPGLTGVSRGLRAVPHAIAAVLVVLAFGFTGGRDLLSVVLHRAGSFSSAAAAVPEFEGSIFGGLLIPTDTIAAAHRPGPTDPDGCQRAYGRVEGQLRLALNGLAALDRAAEPSDAVLVLSGFNPYPALRGAPAPSGGLLWFDAGRTFNRAHHPDAGLLLRSSDAVLRETGCPLETNDLLWELYGDAIEAAFVPAIDAGAEHVYIRRVQAGADPAVSVERSGDGFPSVAGDGSMTVHPINR